MKVPANLTTSMALQFLSQGKASQVCLTRPGRFTALVTYDPKTEEFIIKTLRPRKTGWFPRLTIFDVLFNTKPEILVFPKVA